MLSNSIIRPGEVRDEITSHNSCLTQRINDLTNLSNAVSNYISDVELQGQAYTNSKKHMRVYYIPLYDSLKYACEEIESANSRLERCLGTLDGYYEIDEEKTRNLRDENTRRAIDYENQANRILQQKQYSPITGNSTLAAKVCLAQASHARKVAKDCAETLTALYTFEAETRNLYDRANEMLGKIGAVERGLMNVAFDAGIYTLPIGLDNDANELGKLIQEWLLDSLKRDLPNYTHLTEKLGFTDEELLDMWQQMSDIEKEFFKNLDGTEKGYTKAFQTDPNDLSDDMTLILAIYSSRLLRLNDDGTATPESCKTIELFTNAILRTEITYMYRADNGTESDSGMKYRDIYLQRLFIGTSMLTESNAYTLAMMEKGTNEYKKLYYEYETQLAMTNFWATMNIAVDRISNYDKWVTGIGSVYLIEISDLRFDDNNASYVLSHLGGTEREQINSKLILTGDFIKNEYELEKFRQLEAERDSVWRRVGASVFSGVVSMVVGVFCPVLAMISSVMFMLIEGSADNVTQLDDLLGHMPEGTLKKLGELGINIGDDVVKNIINGMISWRKACAALDQESYKGIMGWFGTGGTYGISGGLIEAYEGFSFLGIYDPDVIRQMSVWEKSGIKGWSEDNDDTWYQILTQIALDCKDDTELYQDCFSLINGGYDIFNMTDYHRFIKAIDMINSKVQGHQGMKNKSSIQTQWHYQIGENGQESDLLSNEN